MHPPKPQPNHERYLEVLRRMSPVDRFRKACELTETARALFRIGLRDRFPHLSEDELQRLYVQHLLEGHRLDERTPPSTG